MKRLTTNAHECARIISIRGHSWSFVAGLLSLWLVAVFPLSAGAQSRQPARYEESHMSMACAWTIVAYGREEKALAPIVEAAFDEIDRIDRLMSHYKPDSPLSRINREAGHGPIAVEPELFDFIAECLRYSRESNGAFDITVGPLMRAWGFFRGEGRMPTKEQLNAARGKIGYRHVLLDPANRTIRFDREGVELDLGGIAKGYAVDRAVAILRSRGIERALVNGCGSTIHGLGSPPGEEGWELKLQDPVNPRKSAMTVRLKDRALSVSGSYEKFFRLNGRRYSHIMDPRTGLPVQGVLSVALLAENGTAGDALDNVYYVQGVKWSRANVARFPATREVIFFLSTTDGRARRVSFKAKAASGSGSALGAPSPSSALCSLSICLPRHAELGLGGPRAELGLGAPRGLPVCERLHQRVAVPSITE